MTKHASLPPVAKRVETTIRFFEENGREVVGVTIEGTKFHLDFAKPDAPVVPDVDLVKMGQ